jgi:hypothetical protein
MVATFAGHQDTVAGVTCEHPLCAIIGGSCSLATGRSRGCRPGLASKLVEPKLFDEVRALLAAIEANSDHAAAVRLAALIRHEAREDRHLLAIARSDEPELAPSLARLCRRAPR